MKVQGNCNSNTFISHVDNIGIYIYIYIYDLSNFTSNVPHSLSSILLPSSLSLSLSLSNPSIFVIPFSLSLCLSPSRSNPIYLISPLSHVYTYSFFLSIFLFPSPFSPSSLSLSLSLSMCVYWVFTDVYQSDMIIYVWGPTFKRHHPKDVTQFRTYVLG